MIHTEQKRIPTLSMMLEPLLIHESSMQRYDYLIMFPTNTIIIFFFHSESNLMTLSSNPSVFSNLSVISLSRFIRKAVGNDSNL